MVGLFNDTAEGNIPDKFPAFRSPYPVIVMELLEGGDMFNHISTRECVTEHYLAETFLSAMWALRSIHERGYVHRDLKLDNLMLVQPSEPSQVKIIDFGWVPRPLCLSVWLAGWRVARHRHVYQYVVCVCVCVCG